MTEVPAGGVPALTAYCVPPCVPLTVHAAPVHVVAAIGVAAARQDVDRDRGRRRDRRRAARDGERHRADELVRGGEDVAAVARRAVVQRRRLAAADRARPAERPRAGGDRPDSAHQAAEKFAPSVSVTAKLVGRRDQRAEIADELRLVDRGRRSRLVVAARRRPAREVRLCWRRRRRRAGRCGRCSPWPSSRRCWRPRARPSSPVRRDQHHRLRESGAAARAPRGGVMPAPCGLPVEDAGSAFTAATSAP